jgi:hypothetical protein
MWQQFCIFGLQNKLMKKIIVIAVLIFTLPQIGKSQLLKNLENKASGNSGGGLSADDVGKGLKDALTRGADKSALSLNLKNGYFLNAAIKIIMPPDAQNAEKTLRNMGFGYMVDSAIVSMNRGAEDAAIASKPIFEAAITHMTITDAMNILKGPNDAATQYLRKTTYDSLYIKFKPIIEVSLNKVGATKYWKEVFDKYNKIPFVKKVNPDLPTYVTGKALDGLFYVIAQEELKIRTNPMAQVDDLLKEVFGDNH